MLRDLLFPTVCLGCGRLLRADPPRSPPLCSACALEHAPLPAELMVVDGIHALIPYAGPVGTALGQLKYQGQPALAGPLGALLARSPMLHKPPNGPHWDAIVPVPLHRRRLIGRGYNQVELMLRWARRSSDRPIAPSRRWIRRVRATLPQASLPAAERHDNVHEAFVASPAHAVRDRHLLVVDDVTTTGATLGACRAALYRAGAAHVGALALMRALA